MPKRCTIKMDVNAWSFPTSSYLHFFIFICCLFTSPLLRGHPVDTTLYQAPIRVACVGDSITDGFGVGRDWDYPSQLGRMLGSKWWVVNFGATGTTMLKNGDDPYWKHGQYTNALGFKPDVVIIALGTNDTKSQNWQHKDEFLQDYQAMIATFQALPSKPSIYLCIPAPVTGEGNMGIPANGPEETGPLIRQLASRIPCELIDFYAALVDHPGWQPDHIHPDPDGDFALAKAVYLALTGQSFEGTMILTSQAPHPVPWP